MVLSNLTSLVSILGFSMLAMSSTAVAQSTTQNTSIDYGVAAREVMRHIQDTFYLPEQGLYAHSLTNRAPDFMWGNGIMFSALVGAARHEPRTYTPIMSRFFKSLDRYWDVKVKIHGYEPVPTRGNGNDKYYDDNAWMVLTFVEAFDQTGEKRYRARAIESLDFVLSGWDDELGGGIWWHEGHKDESKNTCANAPAAVGCLVVARSQNPQQSKASIDMARRIVDWTVKTLEADDGLFFDNIKVGSLQINHAKLTYNTALMIRAYIGLYRATGEPLWLDKAKRAGKAADWFLGKGTGAYRDEVKWSHLMVEADLELYRLTDEPYLLERAKRNADHEYTTWKQKQPDTLIDNASIARTLWLLTDTQTEAGQAFWKRVEGTD